MSYLIDDAVKALLLKRYDYKMGKVDDNTVKPLFDKAVKATQDIHLQDVLKRNLEKLALVAAHNLAGAEWLSEGVDEVAKTNPKGAFKISQSNFRATTFVTKYIDPLISVVNKQILECMSRGLCLVPLAIAGLATWGAVKLFGQNQDIA